MECGWESEDGQHGLRMVMKGQWSSAARDYALANSIKDLELNHAKGWRGEDLSFLADLSSNLESFTIIDFTIDDVEQVHDLRQLRFLDLNTYCKSEVRFSQFPSLEECALEWRPKASSLFEHKGLKKLFISKYTYRDLSSFSNMKRLESLSLASPRIESLAGVEVLERLTFLGVYAARKLTSLQGVEDLVNLVQLEVNDSQRIREIIPVAALTRLKELHICNDGEIETIQPVGGLQSLEKFLFYESTNVLDGDLAPLKKLAHLKSVAFMERPHYSHSRKDFP